MRTLTTPLEPLDVQIRQSSYIDLVHPVYQHVASELTDADAC